MCPIHSVGFLPDPETYLIPKWRCISGTSKCYSFQVVHSFLTRIKMHEVTLYVNKKVTINDDWFMVFVMIFRINVKELVCKTKIGLLFSF